MLGYLNLSREKKHLCFRILFEGFLCSLNYEKLSMNYLPVIIHS